MNRDFAAMLQVIVASLLLLRPFRDVSAAESALGRLNLNTDPRYSRWPTANRIPYQISDGYSRADIDLIHDAIDQIYLDTLGCVRFVEYDKEADAGKDFLIISPSTDGTCWSYPGMLPSGGSGQKMGISGGKSGCLDNKRLIMKTLFHALGKRSEHNRPDRDDYLQMHIENLDTMYKDLQPYQKYLDSTVYYQGFPYDYNSITHHQPSAYARNGSFAFVVRDQTKSIGNKARLSYWDCYAMALQYQCQDIMKNDLCRTLDSYRPTITILSGVGSRPSSGGSLFSKSPFSGGNDGESTKVPARTRPTATSSQATVPTTPPTEPPRSLETTTSNMVTPDQLRTPGSSQGQDSNDDLLLSKKVAPEEMSSEQGSVNNIAEYVQLTRKSTPKNICEPGFRVNAAVQSQDNRILLFSDRDYYVITTSGQIREGPLAGANGFPDVPIFPINAAFTTFESNQRITHIISAQNDYSFVDMTFMDYLPIVEEDLLSPNLQTIFTLPDPRTPNAVFQFRVYGSSDSESQFIQLDAGGVKLPLAKSRLFIGSNAGVPTSIDAVVPFKLGSLGSSVDVALVFSGDMVYLMDVDYSCIQRLKYPCLNSTKRPRFPLPIRKVLNCKAYQMARSLTYPTQ